MYAEFLKITGLTNMTESNVLTLFFAVGVGCSVLGFVTDSMLRNAGFGPVGNALILIAGLVGTAVLYNRYAALYGFTKMIHVLGAIGFGPILLLIFACFFKRTVNRI